MKMKAIVLMIAALLAGKAGQAQPVVANYELETISFFTALLCGVLLTLAFQWVLSTLTAAIGVSVIPKATEDKNKSGSSSDNNSGGTSNVGVKITSAVGFWSILTFSLSVFFASFIASTVFIGVHPWYGVTLGLAVWAASLIIMIYLDMKAVSSFTNGVVSVLKNTFSSVGSAVQSVFTPSTEKALEKRAANVVDRAIDKIEHRLPEFDYNDFSDKLDEYVSELRPKGFDYEKMRKQLAILLKDIYVTEEVNVEDKQVLKDTFVKLSSDQPALSSEDVKILGNLFNEVTDEVQSGKASHAKVAKIFDKATPGSESASRNFRKQLEEFLRQSEVESLQPEVLEHEIDEIVANPSIAKEIFSQKVNDLDHDTIVKAISSNTNIKPENVDKVVDTVEHAIKETKHKYQSTVEGDGGGDGSLSLKGKVKGKIRENISVYEDKLRDFLNSMERPEFNYERFKRDINEIFSSEYSTANVFNRRMKEYDRDSLEALLAKNPRISKEQAHDMIDRILNIREEFMQKVNEYENVVREKARETKAKALQQADQARKIAVAASWVLFAMTVVSGAAAALGGLLTY